MNDFIKKLAIECAGQLEWDFPKDPESYTFTPDEVNRFAELIAMHTKADAISAQTPASCINRSDIIRMARESEWLSKYDSSTGFSAEVAIRFAALVAEEVRGRTIESEKAGWLYALDKVVKEEREACAQVCEEVDDRLTEFHALDCAVAIRARGEK